jgi:hypothetical protein
MVDEEKGESVPTFHFDTDSLPSRLRHIKVGTANSDSALLSSRIPGGGFDGSTETGLGLDTLDRERRSLIQSFGRSSSGNMNILLSGATGLSENEPLSVPSSSENLLGPNQPVSRTNSSGSLKGGTAGGGEGSSYGDNKSAGSGGSSDYASVALKSKEVLPNLPSVSRGKSTSKVYSRSKTTVKNVMSSSTIFLNLNTKVIDGKCLKTSSYRQRRWFLSNDCLYHMHSNVSPPE